MPHAPQPDREMRQQILLAAQDLFITRGYKAVSMKDIAEVVHLTSAGLYYHFPQGKEELVVAMLQGMMQQITVGLETIITQADPFPIQLERIVQLFLAHPFDRLQLLMRDIHTQLPATIEKAAFRESMVGVLAHVSAIFQHASESGAIRADIPSEFLARLFIGMMLTSLQPPPFAPDAMSTRYPSAVSMLIETFLHGINPTNAPA